MLVCDAQVTETFLVKGAGSYIQSFKTFAVSRVRMGEDPIGFQVQHLNHSAITASLMAAL